MFELVKLATDQQAGPGVSAAPLAAPAPLCNAPCNPPGIKLQESRRRVWKLAHSRFLGSCPSQGRRLAHVWQSHSCWQPRWLVSELVSCVSQELAALLNRHSWPLSNGCTCSTIVLQWLLLDLGSPRCCRIQGSDPVQQAGLILPPPSRGGANGRLLWP